MKIVILGVLLILTSGSFAAECFYGEDWVTLKKICSECSGIDPNTMTDTEAVNTIRNELLPYIKKLKRTAKSHDVLQKKHEQQANDLEVARQAKVEAERTARNRYIVLSVIAYSVLAIGILLIAGFAYLTFRASRKGGQIYTLNADPLHCPRCGWEHGPDETVCKNCKTRF